MASFAELNIHERLLKSLQALDYQEPTKVQIDSIPTALTGVDIQVAARTGSGKTCAFILPMLQRLMTETPAGQGMRALVLAPTRELAQQILKEAQGLAKFSKISFGLVTGGESFTNQVKILRRNPEVIIATPGRIKEHIEKGNTDLRDLEVLILDEADRMLEMGFQEDVTTLANKARSARQTMLFSATMARKGMDEVIAQVLQKPTIIIVDQIEMAHAHIEQQMILADSDGHKNQLLNWLLSNEQYQKVIVFVNAKTVCDLVADAMSKQSNKVATLHGDMEQLERTQITRMFRDGHFQILVATDIAARGLDIANVDLVINYHMARNGDDYIHRIGRTGRNGAKGLAISLIGSNEVELQQRIAGYAQAYMAPRILPGLAAKAVSSRHDGNHKGRSEKVASNKRAATDKKRFADKQVDMSDGFSPLKRRPKSKLLPDQDETE